MAAYNMHANKRFQSQDALSQTCPFFVSLFSYKPKSSRLTKTVSFVSIGESARMKACVAVPLNQRRRNLNVSRVAYFVE